MGSRRVGHDWATSHSLFTFMHWRRSAHSSVLAWRIPGTAEPGGLPSMGSHRVGHDWSDLAAAAAVLPLSPLSLLCPQLPSPTETTSLLFVSVNLFLFCYPYRSFLASLQFTQNLIYMVLKLRMPLSKEMILFHVIRLPGYLFTSPAAELINVL